MTAQSHSLESIAVAYPQIKPLIVATPIFWKKRSWHNWRRRRHIEVDRDGRPWQRIQEKMPKRSSNKTKLRHKRPSSPKLSGYRFIDYDSLTSSWDYVFQYLTPVEPNKLRSLPLGKKVNLPTCWGHWLFLKQKRGAPIGYNKKIPGKSLSHHEHFDRYIPKVEVHPH